MAYDDMNTDDLWTTFWSQPDHLDALNLFTDDSDQAQHASGNFLAEFKTRWMQNMFDIPTLHLPSTHTASVPLLTSPGALGITPEDFNQHAATSYESIDSETPPRAQTRVYYL
ncbi:hypothetical protein Slin14017_G039180 [Septoria linicola]|nr:hypothetical protein Slin14017_G039180 [Septoria linicola]